MNCKNCGHALRIMGEVSGEVSHTTSNFGIVKKCPECSCENPERKRKSKHCSNCGCEIIKRGGEWLHIVHYHALNSRYYQRLGRDICFEHGCNIPTPIN